MHTHFLLGIYAEVEIYFGFHPTAITVIPRRIDGLSRRCTRWYQRAPPNGRPRRPSPDDHPALLHLLHFVGCWHSHTSVYLPVC